MDREWTFWATVTGIWDGDTFYANCDLGLGFWAMDVTGVRRRIRFANTRAPELDEVGGIEAKKYLQDVLPVGMRVKIISHRLDQNGRPIATVMMQQGDTMLDVGQMTITAGYAQPWDAIKGVA